MHSQESAPRPAGNDCPWAHGVYEVLLHPMRHRVDLCKDFVQFGVCTRAVCFFAHSPAQQRLPDTETVLRYQVLQVRALRPGRGSPPADRATGGQK